MTDKLRVERLGRLLEIMDDWPADARPDRRESAEGEERISTILAMGLGCGWLEQSTQHSPCDGCGKPKADHSFYQITAAGQAALDVAKAIRAEAQSRAYPQAGPDIDDDEFELGILEKAAQLLREDASHHNVLIEDARYLSDSDRHRQDRDQRLELAKQLDRINHERNVISLSGVISREQAERLAKHHRDNSFGINGLTMLEGDELEEYLSDRLSDSLDIDWQTRDGAKMIASCFADDGWEVRRKAAD